METGADEGGDAEPEADAESEPDGDEELPADLIEEAERLTRLARKAVDEEEAAAYRSDRERRLAEHDFTARVREGDDTLVLHPEEWLEDGLARVDRIEDTSRAIERPLSGPGDPDDWQAVEEYNASLVERVTAEHGETHGANARAFADFMGNHYAKRMDEATDEEVAEFLAEYFPRNAWPTDEQRDLAESSVGFVFESTDR
ncbi:rnhA operon protein [Halorarum salinum]|uniref:RnhA operon protein n=1 Tax=Halorarum salinum TaxID=2743089 RepID=A0A7D5LDF5_9EURY|nr:rnhA operon protein [Halobaculum salinum]